jgi:plastocyanin
MWRLGVLALVVSLVAACSDRVESNTDDRVERVVLVDFRHDEFASAFLRYYPASVQVRPGDTVRFKQTWTGEPHSVTMGRVVEDLLSIPDELYQYATPEEALAAGISEEEVDKASYAATHIPGMTADQYDVYQPGARPCFVAAGTALPLFADPTTGAPREDASCPNADVEPPPFVGDEPLYNSGFISPEGDEPNTFKLPISEDARPGTYRYFCNYHWIGMSGAIEVVEATETIPSQGDVNRRARTEIAADAAEPLKRIRQASDGNFGGLTPPLAGRSSNDDPDDDPVVVNEFLPNRVDGAVGEPLTWTIDGAPHTVSFNVPKYFPSLDVRGGRVVWDPRSFRSVGWTLPEPVHLDQPDESALGAQGQAVDAGEWDGRGFRSSGVLEPGDSFTVTFTRAGTYPFACLLHPQMVGVVDIDR